MTNVNPQCVMCNVCCKQFQGWCRAFTAAEAILSILQAILLTLFVAFLTFLILHFIACAHNETSVTRPVTRTTETFEPTDRITSHVTFVPTGPSAPGEVTSSGSTGNTNSIASTLSPDVACTWTPSARTGVVTQYFERSDVDMPVNIIDDSGRRPVTPALYDEFLQPGSEDTGVFDSNQFDGELAGYEKSFITALVKLKPPDDVTFGCTLTVISEFWTLTAASCIESIEELDSLDSFVIIESFGEPTPGRTHPAADVLVHPQYQGTNKTYDIAALKSGNKLTIVEPALRLPTTLDYLLMTIGERLVILGYGKFRSIELDGFRRRAHAVAVHVLPSAQCAARSEGWSARHLTGGARAVRGRCGHGSLCAGPLHARGTPCNYCAGTPLLRARTLLGLMAGPGPCGASCEPALYVNLAASQDWLRSVLDGH